MVLGLNVLYICIPLKILVKITKNIRIIDLQKRVCNGKVIEQFKEDYILRAFGTSIL